MTSLAGTKAWSGRVAPGAAVAFGVLTFGAGLATVPLDRLAHQPDPHGPLSLLFLVVFLTPGVTVGTVLAARRPRNPIGWMLLAFYFLAIAPAGDYAIIDYRLHHGHLPLGSVAVVALASWPVWLVLIANLLWVFPDGRLPQGRWRRVAVVLMAAGVLLAVAATAGGAAAVAGHTVRVNASGNLVDNTPGMAGLAQGAVAVGVLASLLVWLAVQVPRYRQSAGERRPLFNPLRRRVQHAVDRRFNRARYNADLTVAAFASRLKDAVDLELGPRGPGRCRAESPGARPHLSVDERTRRNRLSRPWPAGGGPTRHRRAGQRVRRVT